MKQPLLITKSKAAEYVQVAIGCSDKEFERFIREAQEFDLKDLLCEDFYYDLLKKSTEDPYLNILPGKEYEHDGKTYYHEGLEAVLAYFSYARFILKGNVVSTSHGFVVKKQDANKLFENVAKYMDRKEINYKDCHGCGNDTASGGDIVIRAMEW